MKKITTTIVMAVLLLVASAHAFTGDNANSLPFGESSQPDVMPIGDGSRPTIESPDKVQLPPRNEGGKGSRCLKYEWITVNNAVTPFCAEKKQSAGFWDLHSFLRA